MPQLDLTDVATEQDVRELYSFVLQRDPDEAGWTHWSNVVKQQPLPLRALWQMFTQSQEARLLEEVRRAPKPKSGPRFLCVNLKPFRMYVDTRDRIVCAAITATREYEPQVAEVIRNVLRPGATFLDLGANVGYFTLFAAALVGPQGRVIAFEPRADNVALITLSLRENEFSNVELHPLAVAESNQEFKVYPEADNSLSQVVESTRQMAPAQRFQVVRAVQLDSFLDDLPRLDVIKMDIDGNEVRALQGMRQLIRRHRPAIVFEFAPEALQQVGRIEPAALLEGIFELGYDIHLIGPSVEGPLDLTSIMTAYRRSGSTHVDLVAYPKTQA